MSFQAMAWAVKQKPAGSKEKFVLLMLANYASNNEGECHPSIQEICEATMLSKDSVIRALKSLEDDGLITTIRKRQGRVNLVNSYTLTMREVVADSDPAEWSQPAGGSRTERLGVVAQSDPNLSEEPIKAKPRENRYDEILDKCLAAAGIDGFRDERNPKLASIAPILGLLDAGYDLDADILPVIRAKCASGFKPRSWSYFVEPVRGEKQDRTAAASKPNPQTFAPKPKLEGYETVDRYRDPDLFAACERLQGKTISVMIQKPSFPSDLVERARQQLRSAA